MDFGGRKQAFTAVVGSHNYNLDTPSSDKDRKVFVLPTFEDLYYGKSYSKSVIGETEDLDVHDVRKLGQLLYKANVNFLEVLYTTDFGFSGDAALYTHVRKIFDMKDDLVTMNLPYLFNACGGMFLNKMKQLEKGTEGTQHLVDEFGYDTKQALHAYRILNFVVRFADNQFERFDDAMTYHGEEKDFMLGIKYGNYTLDGFKEMVSTYEEEKFKPLRELYHAQPVKEDVKEKLDAVILQMVKEEVAS